MISKLSAGTLSVLSWTKGKVDMSKVGTMAMGQGNACLGSLK